MTETGFFVIVNDALYSALYALYSLFMHSITQYCFLLFNHVFESHGKISFHLSSHYLCYVVLLLFWLPPFIKERNGAQVPLDSKQEVHCICCVEMCELWYRLLEAWGIYGYMVDRALI
jgi:hypothetical protein